MPERRAQLKIRTCHLFTDMRQICGINYLDSKYPTCVSIEENM